ncbi:MAG TPA: response regulator transcription factor [Luteibacter sp.]|uniref:response regulator transcription factor n=1 Tax=Luteibacter sp. TaxID=1886636 RepID=UPI002BBA3138|nr:response regulator transcription factor [Luteibacter sp.]HVI56013.1 response regulator transcription factor [Luteibacter sp.]
MPALRILVVDDHPLFRVGVTAILTSEADLSVVGEASTGTEGIEAFQTLRPDITLVDLKLPDMDGDQVITTVRKATPAAKFVVLTTYGGDAAARRALSAGAQGYLLKTSLVNELVATVRAVHAGQHHVSAAVAKELSEHRSDECLTEREIAVLRGVAAGMENKQIAQWLGISADTVKEHLSRAMAKLHASNRSHALAIALSRGFLA